MDEDEGEGAVVVEPIVHYNAMQEAALRYWRASRIWRNHEDAGNWTFGAMIQELNDVRCYRGIVAGLAAALLDKVVRDERPKFVSANDERIGA